jgi:hypothetical protein
MRELDVIAAALNVALMQPLYAREVHHEGFANRIWKNRYPILIRGTRSQLLRRARTAQELTLNARECPADRVATVCAFSAPSG